MLTKYIDMDSAPGNSRAIISYERYYQLQGRKDDVDGFDKDKKLHSANESSPGPKKGACFVIIPLLVGLSFYIVYMVSTGIDTYISRTFLSGALNKFCRKDCFTF
jgi:hypothetical protein